MLILATLLDIAWKEDETGTLVDLSCKHELAKQNIQHAFETPATVVPIAEVKCFR